MCQEKTMYRKLDCGCAYEIVGNTLGEYYEETLTKFISCQECEEVDEELKASLLKEIEENDEEWFSSDGNSCLLLST